MSPVNYVTMLEGKSKESKFQLRLRLVRYAQKKGIREAARAFGCSRNTVRLWLRRYEADGIKGLQEKRKAPRHIPHKTSKYQEKQVIQARKQVPCYGAARLKTMFRLKPSVGAIGRILRANGLTQKTRRKYQKKRDLRKIKAAYKALTHHQMDTKHLYDIPTYWPYMRRLGLPKYQYTIRDSKSGALILAYADSCCITYAKMAAERYLEHLQQYGIECGEIILQTDQGSEFSGGRRKRAERGFTHALEQKWRITHDFIPRGCPNANADVETSHRLIEQELFDLEAFSSRRDFLRKAAIYQNYFNFARQNSYKGHKTPWEIISRDRPGLSPEVLRLPPVILDDEFRKSQLPHYYSQVGQHLPVVPAVHKKLIDDELIWEIARSLERLYLKHRSRFAESAVQKPKDELAPHPALVNLLERIKEAA